MNGEGTYSPNKKSNTISLCIFFSGIQDFFILKVRIPVPIFLSIPEGVRRLSLHTSRFPVSTGTFPEGGKFIHPLHPVLNVNLLKPSGNFTYHQA
jgi:hypothetical protein